MNIDRKVVEQALDALETLDCGDTYKTHNAATALRQALEQHVVTSDTSQERVDKMAKQRHEAYLKEKNS